MSRFNLQFFPPEALPNVDHLVTEDDEPLDSIFSEKQQRLLVSSLYSSWQGQRFIALANVGLFYAIEQPPLVPDVMVSLDVKLPDNLWIKSHRSYCVWIYLKPPDVVIEIVSNQKGEETGRKLELYENIGVPYYAIFDPDRYLSKHVLRVFELHQAGYVETHECWMPKVGLGLRLWEGRYENLYDTWLRWYVAEDRQRLILTGTELAQQAEQAAREAEQRAQEANCWLQVEKARQHNERLEAQLRSLGIDPDKS